MPSEPSRPGYVGSPDLRLVSDLIQSMDLENKIRQLFGVPIPADPTNAYGDIERSQDAESGNGWTVRGYKYRDAGRGVNLASGQPTDRPSRGFDYATAFPAPSVRAASWDLELERQIGEAIGDETMVSKNNLLKAPCLNLVRHPYWGRTQESYGEDMYHVGRMGSAFTAGLQQHVVGCAKHFLAHNIEFGSAEQNSQLDEQALRDVYGRPFEVVIRDAGIGCIMTAHNSVNGTRVTQNRHLLTDVLRKPVEQGGMGFRGFVLSSPWSMPGEQAIPDAETARTDAKVAIRAGLDVEVPWALHYSQLASLVENGELSEAEINQAAQRVLEQKSRFNTLYSTSSFGLGVATTKLVDDSIANNEAHLALAEEAEIRSAVLLANGAPGAKVLPIAPDIRRIAVVGLELPIIVTNFTQPPKTGSTMRYARDVNLGDRGSSRVNADPEISVGPYEGIQAIAASHSAQLEVTVANSAGDSAVKDADFVAVVVGLSAGDEGEEYSLASGGDRTSLALPGGQEDFINDVLNLGKPTAILIESGSIVNLPWLAHANQRQATIWAGYGGQRAGLAYGRLLFGDRNFSGKLPLAWPAESELLPFRGAAGTTEMSYFFGYRDYDDRLSRGLAVKLVFPFGHGLSYTTFEYSNLNLPCDAVSKNNIVNITADITNTGGVDGDEVMLLFVSGPRNPPGISGKRPVKELKGFQRVSLKASGPEATKRVTFPLEIRDLRHWEGDANGQWVIDDGDYEILIGPNASDNALKLRGRLRVHG